jgi:N-acyl-D-amino-acid deacylase
VRAGLHDCKISQGVTTVVCRQLRRQPLAPRASSAPAAAARPDRRRGWWRFDSFGDYAHELKKRGSEVNTYALVGHQTLRVEAMDGDVYARPRIPRSSTCTCA